MTAANTAENRSLDAVVGPICTAHGVELVDVKYLRMKTGGIVRVLIDRPRSDGDLDKGSAVSISDCQQVSRDIATALELREDLVSGRYHLEVSSPGLDRPLVKLEDFGRFAGREAKIQTRLPVAERRNFQGVIEGVDGESVRVSVDGQPFVIPFAEISKANLVPRF
ncbi:MAG: ribosome maturation factor RimP [Polyangiales bacterium]|nr:ribosome maturation factor RimP [Myxococcales bacterium]